MDAVSIAGNHTRSVHLSQNTLLDITPLNFNTVKHQAMNKTTQYSFNTSSEVPMADCALVPMAETHKWLIYSHLALLIYLTSYIKLCFNITYILKQFKQSNINKLL